jgi:NADH:ubiquinone oxidoreductase subunit 6 (subunit J)
MSVRDRWYISEELTMGGILAMLIVVAILGAVVAAVLYVVMAAKKTAKAADRRDQT